MNVLVKSSNGITQVSADAKLLSQRKVFIEGEISPETACEFIKKIIVLNAENQEKFIDVLINSPGGEINSGLAMYDVIQSSKAPIRVFYEVRFIDDLRKAIYCARNENFHFKTALVNDEKWNTELFGKIFKRETEFCLNVEKDRFYSNNLYMFYQVSELRNMLDHLYSSIIAWSYQMVACTIHTVTAG